MRWSRIWATAAVVIMVINIASAASHVAALGWVERVKAPKRSIVGKVLNVSSGVDVQGRRWKARDASCRVIRITDDDCAYCQRDAPAYSLILDVARESSCDVLEIAPKAGQLAENVRDGVVQIEFIDADLGPTVFPFATPQTVIVDRMWVVKWSHRGVIDEGSLASSSAVIRSLAK